MAMVLPTVMVVIHTAVTVLPTVATAPHTVATMVDLLVAIMAVAMRLHHSNSRPDQTKVQLVNDPLLSVHKDVT